MAFFRLPVLGALALGLPALPVWAVDTGLTSAGFTGLGITPNAHVLGWGRAEAAYDNQLPGVVPVAGPRGPRGHNFVLGVGFLPNLEVAGRLATNELHSSCFTVRGCGARDLSASTKVAIGLDSANRFRVAVGATDLGGAATLFRSYYGVLSFDEGMFQANAGVARRSGAGVAGSRSPLHGPFASVGWQPLPVVRAHVEYADGQVWSGVRLFAPSEWLPQGWQLSAGVNVRITNNQLTERAWWSTSLSIPLYKVPDLPATHRPPLRDQGVGISHSPVISQPRALPSAPAIAEPGRPSAQQASPARDFSTPIAPRPTDADLQKLADALQAKGFEDIWVGRMPDETVAVRANNSAYRWNSADALGAVLGAIASTLGDRKAGYRLLLTQRQLPIVAVTGQADCLREWIEQPTSSCAAGQLSTPGGMPLDPLHAGAEWIVQRQSPAWKALRLNVSPVLRTAVGTDVGALDYAVGANVTAQQPLWPGASVDWSVNAPLAASDDYERTGTFSQRRIRGGTERLAFTQTARVPLEWWVRPADHRRWGAGALTAQLTVGRIGTFYDGGLAALRWEPGEGLHRLSAETGVLRNNAYDNGRGPLGTLRRAAPLLVSHRYSFIGTRTDLETTVGRFMNNDQGVQFMVRQWFADVSVAAFYRRSGFSGQPDRQFAGVELSLPIGPRRDWRPAEYLQVGGAQRFSHSIQTVIRETRNPLVTGHGVMPPTPGLNATFNSDRSGLAYFEDNLRRIRDAAR